MQHRRELFSRQKTVKDINEDSGLSSRDLPSVESDSCMKSAQEENLGEQVRKMCIQPDKPSFSTSTPTANRRPSFSLPRIFAQKKHDASVATAAATTVTLADEQPQLSPGTTTTTTTSAYNTGVDTGQESPPANTKKQCSTTVNSSVRSTMLDGRNTVGTKITSTTASVPAGVQQQPSMLPTLPRTKQLSRKQHVRFQSDSVSFLPPAVFYTSAERLAETIATQQRLLHQELSINELPQKQQQMGKECPISSRQQNWQNIAKCQTEQLNKKVPLPPPPNKQHIVVQYPRIQPPRQQLVKDAYASLRQQKAQQQYTSDTVQRANSQSQILQYSKDTAMLRPHSSNEAAKGQQVQQVQAYQQQQYPHDNTQQRVKVQQNVLHYPKETTTLQYHSSNAPAKGQQLQHEAQTNPQTGSLRRQQKPPKQQQQQLKVGKVQSLSYQQTQLPYAMSGVHSTTLLYPSDTTKSATLHRTEKRMTAAGDALSIGQELRHQQQHHPAAEANVLPSPTTTGFLNRRDCSANLAQNLPRSDWPRGAELAELFAFRPTAAASAFGHNKQQHQREKRRGSPSKQISGQHRQQPELEWVIKRRSDGTRYVTRRPARKRTPSILAAVKARREQSLARERAGMSTTDDDGGSEAMANAGVALLKWWGQQHSSRRKPPPIPSAFSPSSLARKKPSPAAGGGVIRTDQSDPQKAFTITTV